MDEKPRLNKHQERAPTRREILGKAIGLGGVAAAVGPAFVGDALARSRKHYRRRRTVAPVRAFDLRHVGANNYISSVKDQGNCNSCTAFAVIAAIEGSYSFQKNQPIPAGGPEPSFSESQLFFCNVPKGCDVTAWFPEDALNACMRAGVTDRANNPYDPANPRGMCKLQGPDWNFTRLASTVRLRNDREMKQWISGTHPDGPGGPVIAVMVEYKDLRDFAGGETDTYSPANDAANNPRIGGHVVCIVGFDDTDPQNQFWICKNSWGTTYWNPNGRGYFRVKQEKTGQRMTYIDSFDMWGVVVA